MNRWAWYNFAILSCGAVGVLVLLVVSLGMRGDGGELARLGGFRYDDFRPQSGVVFFTNPLFRLARTIEEYDQPFDVVVLGDSFSRNEISGWQNYFVGETGASLITFDIQRTSVEEITRSPVYRKNPPVLFVYQIVERSLWLRHGSCAGGLAPNVPPSTRAIDSEPVEVAPVVAPRELEEVAGLNAAANVLSKTFLRKVLGLNVTRVAKLPLERAGLFSNQRSDELLVYRDDLLKRQLSLGDLDIVSCSLTSVRQKAESGGKTAFFALVFPDKLSVYGGMLTDRLPRGQNHRGMMPILSDERLVSLEDVFREAVAAGTMDLYLPDDTHAGPVGHELAADFLASRLRALGYIRRSNNAVARDEGTHPASAIHFRGEGT